VLNLLDLYIPCLSKPSDYGYLKDNQVEDSQKIYYKAPIPEPIDKASCSSGSPIYSTMQPPTFSSINYISNPFEISKDYLIRNFNSIENGFIHTLIWMLNHS